MRPRPTAACGHAARPATLRPAGAPKPRQRHCRAAPDRGNSVKIKSIEPIAVSLPMTKPVKMAGETVARADNVLVRIEADNGHVGWGEAASAPTMTGETVASMMAAVDLWRPVVQATRRRLCRRFGGDGRADVRQQRRQSRDRDRAARSRRPRHGRPLHALLGANCAAAYRCSRSSAPTMPPADLREAQERRNAGYRVYKVKVGVATPEADAARTRGVCQRRWGQANCLISADANQGWNAEEGCVTCVRSPMPGSISSSSRPRPRSCRHGAGRRGKPRADRRRRGHSFARRHRAPSRSARPRAA